MARGSNSRNGRSARSEYGTVLSSKFANDRPLEAKLIADGKADYQTAIEMDNEVDRFVSQASKGDNDALNDAAKEMTDARDRLEEFIKDNLDPDKVKFDPTFAKMSPKNIAESNADLKYLLKEETQDKYDELVEDENIAFTNYKRVQEENENPAINAGDAINDIVDEIREFQDYSNLDNFYGGAASGVRPYTRNIESVANKMIQYGRRHGETAGEISSIVRSAIREVNEAALAIGRYRSDMQVMKENNETDEVKIAGTYARHQEATRRYIENATEIARIAVEQRDLYNGLRRYDNRPTRGDED